VVVFKISEKTAHKYIIINLRGLSLGDFKPLPICALMIYYLHKSEVYCAVLVLPYTGTSGTHRLCFSCRPLTILLPHRNERLLLVRCPGKMREPTLDPARRTDIRRRGNL